MNKHLSIIHALLLVAYGGVTLAQNPVGYISPDFWSGHSNCTNVNCRYFMQDEPCYINLYCACGTDGTTDFPLRFAECVGQNCPNDVAGAYDRYSNDCEQQDETLGVDREEFFGRANVPLPAESTTSAATTATATVVSDSNASEASPGGFSNSDKIAIGVGLGVGLPTILIGIIALILQRRQKNRQDIYQGSAESKPLAPPQESQETLLTSHDRPADSPAPHHPPPVFPGLTRQQPSLPPRGPPSYFPSQGYVPTNRLQSPEIQQSRQSPALCLPYNQPPPLPPRS